jgi:CO/xanthine dehydrogenase Mo-binding subunit/aerobic-type carbon monoxide dehydrogenase small subunit (CoxS/CutS family)
VVVNVNINGKSYSVDCDPKTRLIDYLRDGLHFTGTKEGCGKGHCGSCSVLIDGRLHKACIVQMSNVNHANILTIEGLSCPDNDLHPIQQAFIEEGAVQCGFCTPGMIMAAKALLDRTLEPTDEDIASALESNICRCTGYVPIVKAIKRSAKYLKEDLTLFPFQEISGIGRAKKIDVVKKVKGQETYAADLYFKGMLYGGVFRSPFDHAEIVSIDCSDIETYPGVVCTVTAKDIPGETFFGRGIGTIDPVIDQPVLASKKVRFRGEPIVGVVGVSKEVVEKALKLVKVTFKELEAVYDPKEALLANAPRIHEGGNLVWARVDKILKGDVNRGFKEADVIVENFYRTSFNEHAYLEPEAGVATFDGSKLTIHCSTQDIYKIRDDIASVLNLPPSAVRVVQTAVGGGFGGKLDSSFQVILALLAYKSKTKVKMVYSREESFIASYKRHPMNIYVKTGATEDGRLVALEADVLGDAGAYAFRSPPVLLAGLIHITGPYRWHNVKVIGRMAYTNNPITGPMRGYGIPQITYAVESQMELMSKRLGINPLEFRKMNAYRNGDTTLTGQELKDGVGIVRTIEAIEPYYEEAVLSNKSFKEKNKLRGSGLACVWFGIGRGALSNPSEARIELSSDGSINLYCAAADLGQGAWTALTQIPSELLNQPLNKIGVFMNDSEVCPSGNATCGSRQTHYTGSAAYYAAMQLKSALLKLAGEISNKQHESFELVPGFVKSREEEIPLSRIWEYARQNNIPTSYVGRYDPKLDIDCNGKGSPYTAYSFGTHLAEVVVDQENGEVKVLRLVAAYDVGRAINPQGVEGQIYGASAMGIGFALKEKYTHGVTKNFKDYKIPRIKDIGEIVPIIVECPSSEGPFGAKGVGEPPLIGAGAAISNAILNACKGLPPRELPASPEVILRLLKFEQ